MTYVRVFEAPDGSQCLVYIYDDGTVEVSRRDRAGDRWSPPMELVSLERSA